MHDTMSQVHSFLPCVNHGYRYFGRVSGNLGMTAYLSGVGVAENVHIEAARREDIKLFL